MFFFIQEYRPSKYLNFVLYIFKKIIMLTTIVVPKLISTAHSQSTDSRSCKPWLWYKTDLSIRQLFWFYYTQSFDNTKEKTYTNDSEIIYSNQSSEFFLMRSFLFINFFWSSMTGFLHFIFGIINSSTNTFTSSIAWIFCFFLVTFCWWTTDYFLEKKSQELFYWRKSIHTWILSPTALAAFLIVSIMDVLIRLMNMRKKCRNERVCTLILAFYRYRWYHFLSFLSTSIFIHETKRKKHVVYILGQKVYPEIYRRNENTDCMTFLSTSSLIG